MSPTLGSSSLPGSRSCAGLIWGVGPAGLEFSKLTGFPADRLLADPENETYSKLPFKSGALATFFNPKVRQAVSAQPVRRLNRTALP